MPPAGSVAHYRRDLVYGHVQYGLYCRGRGVPVWYLPAVCHLSEKVKVRFVTGYADGQLPAPLKAAVVELGSRLLEGDLDISKMSWESGLSADYKGATAETLPVSVRELIEPWTFASFG